MQNGQLQQLDFFDNVGGLNLTDSVFKVKDNQASGGTNWNYTQTGAVQTRKGLNKVNTVADTQLTSLGLGQFFTSAGTKTNLKAAGNKIQSISIENSGTLVTLTDDTVSASSTSILSTSTQQVLFNQFNSATVNTNWIFGGGLTTPIGAYSATKFTGNGAATPAGSISLAQGAGSATFPSTGTYFYGVALHKASTGVTSNVVLDQSITLSATTNQVTVTLTGITAFDTTKYDQIYIYRSALGGVTGFTTGDLIAQIASTSTSYVDTGTSVSSSINIARANNTLLDNSQLSAGTYKVSAVWKRRLVTAANSTLYFSDLNKPESWPTGNTITIPSGGPITGLAIISFATYYANDEYLAVFKENELWLVTGTSLSDWAIKLVDISVGCPAQTLIVSANGYLFWVGYRGVFMWNGFGKPIYVSRPIETLFGIDGDIDKPNLALGCGVYSRKTNSVIWFISHRTYGVQQAALKLDLRLTLPSIENKLEGQIVDGVFIIDSYSMPLYSALSYLPQTQADEVLLVGDNAGFVYKAYETYVDGSSAYTFQYTTKHLDMGNPNLDKRFYKVIAWVQDIGTWKLTLNYWTNYRFSTADEATQALQISTENQQLFALWDLAYWDQAFWDQYTPKVVPVVFNLQADPSQNNEGDSIKLQFQNANASEPITLVGFSVLWAPKGSTK